MTSQPRPHSRESSYCFLSGASEVEPARRAVHSAPSYTTKSFASLPRAHFHTCAFECAFGSCREQRIRFDQNHRSSSHRQRETSMSRICTWIGVAAIASVTCLGGLPQAGADVLNINPAADGSVQDLDHDGTFDVVDVTDLDLRNFDFPSFKLDSRGIAEFNLAGVPAGAIIDSATFVFTTASFTTSTPTVFIDAQSGEAHSHSAMPPRRPLPWEVTTQPPSALGQPTSPSPRHSCRIFYRWAWSGCVLRRPSIKATRSSTAPTSIGASPPGPLLVLTYRVPEPSSLVLGAIGVAALAFRGDVASTGDGRDAGFQGQQMRSSSSSVTDSGGMMTITLPSGRSSTPCCRAQSQTASPRCLFPGIGLRGSRDRATSSMPAIRPHCRTSPTCGCWAIRARCSRQPRDLGRQAGRASALPRTRRAWPAPRPRPADCRRRCGRERTSCDSAYVPRKACQISSVASVAASGR